MAKKHKAEDMEPSPALRIIDKYPATLAGRAVGILVTDGADGRLVTSIKKAVEDEGVTVKIIAPRVGGVILKGGKSLPVDGQLAGSPSVIFDAVALVFSEEGGELLLKEAAAVDFVRDAFGHLKAIGFTDAARPLLDKAAVVPDAGVVDLAKVKDFIGPAQTRLWAREPSIRTLA